MRVLLIDDSPEIRERLRSLLSQLAGIEVVAEAAGVGEALDLAAACSPEVVILDLRLPDGTGFEALPRLKRLPASPRVIVFTNYSDPTCRRRAVQLGAECLLDKSKDIDRLVGVLEELRQKADCSG